MTDYFDILDFSDASNATQKMFEEPILGSHEHKKLQKVCNKNFLKTSEEQQILIIVARNVLLLQDSMEMTCQSLRHIDNDLDFGEFGEFEDTIEQASNLFYKIMSLLENDFAIVESAFWKIAPKEFKNYDKLFVLKDGKILKTLPESHVIKNKVLFSWHPSSNQD